MVDFYQRIYDNDRRTDRTQIDEFIRECELDKISEPTNENINEQITLEELEPIVSQLSSNKSPGWDGLTAEFYKYFWDDIKHIVFSSYLESIENVSMSPSQRIGVLTLIPKPKPPPDLVYIKNWRPITLLNVDYKIFTHAVKNRIIETLPHLISQAQTGFQSGKSTHDNLILMSMVLEHYEKNNYEEGLILQVDFQRAFDSVEHYFLFKVMESMGFGSYILKLVKTAFAGCMSFININGHLSSPVYICRGLHQGSPLSPVLFLLVAQVFNRRLELNNDIVGINISGVDLLLSLYADDTDMFLKASISCLEAIILELEIFGSMSGCKANMDKTGCIPLGRARSNNLLLNEISAKFGESFIYDDFTALGLKFNNHSTCQEIAEQNYTMKIVKALDNINLWKARDLTLFGRVTIIKSLLMSQFVYLIVPLLSPIQSTCKKIEKLVFNYLWGGKPDKIKRNIMTQSRDEGGVSMIDPLHFIYSLKLKLLQKVFDENFSHPWKKIFLKQLLFPDHPIISVENNLYKKDCHFASNLGNCYMEWKKKSGEINGKCIDHCIWQNSLIKDLNRKLWHEKLIRYQILYISELVDDEGNIMNYREFCRARLGGAHHVVNPKDYGDIRMAIRRFCNTEIPTKNVSNIDSELKINFFIGTPNIRTHKIREKVAAQLPVDEIPALKAWTRDLAVESINWELVFRTLYGTFTNNFKIIQFQFKLLHRVSTCRYMRYKMNIDRQSGNCYNCNTVLETLMHIYIECPITNLFVARVNRLIKEKIDPSYSDDTKIFYLTCSHTNPTINFLWAIAKYYISRNFQNKKNFHWVAFINFMKLSLIGEKPYVVTTITDILEPT